MSLINTFQAYADADLDLKRQMVLDNAQAMRDLVDVLLVAIGDPLAIIAASNQEAADALDAIANGTYVIDAIKEHNIVTENILDEGLDDISNAIETIGPKVASAVRQAVQGVSVVVNVTIERDELVNE